MDQRRQSGNEKPAASKADPSAARHRTSSAQPESPAYDKKTDGPDIPSV